MSEGLQIRDPNDRIILDTTIATSRVLGVLQNVGTNGLSGAIYDPAFATGRPFYLFSPKSIGTNSYGTVLIPSVDMRVTNNTFYWTLYVDGPVDCGSIIYGVY